MPRFTFGMSVEVEAENLVEAAQKAHATFSGPASKFIASDAGKWFEGDEGGQRHIDGASIYLAPKGAPVTPVKAAAPRTAVPKSPTIPNPMPSAAKSEVHREVITPPVPETLDKAAAKPIKTAAELLKERLNT